jgi:two-component system phosphate regulon sensor histidine kinase PhoR
MTHELKTPVATIGIASQMLHEDNVITASDKVLKYAEIIQEENLRLGGHIEKVLQVAQLEQGSIKLNMKGVDVHEILDKLKASYKLRIEAANGVLTEERQATNHEIYGDEQHLYNLFSNLYDNAIKYSKEELTIAITTRSNQQFLEIVIRDNGIGMSSSVQRHIFDAFFRESSGNIHNVKGFGLGLSYVKAMTERHAGSIRVQSEEGQFAEFTLIFPLNNKK